MRMHVRLHYFIWIIGTERCLVTFLDEFLAVITGCGGGFLNQARAGRRPVRAWFLIIDPVRIVCMRACVCVCVSAPEAINN